MNAHSAVFNGDMKSHVVLIHVYNLTVQGLSDVAFYVFLVCVCVFGVCVT